MSSLTLRRAICEQAHIFSLSRSKTPAFFLRRQTNNLPSFEALSTASGGRQFQSPHRTFADYNSPTPEQNKRNASFITQEEAQTAQSSRDAESTDLPSNEESRRTHLSKRFTTLMDTVQGNIFVAGQRLNDLTGYSGIEALKMQISVLETTVRESRLQLKQARAAYEIAIKTRSASQREVNELLQRKHAWNAADLERFTSLYRNDHANEQTEAKAQEELAMAERAAEEATGQLSRSILARYHEEQIWSDKIRRMSTWGTWGLMGVNVLLFLVFQILVEPWRRRRLIGGFEEKVKEALEREKIVGDGDTVTEEAGKESAAMTLHDVVAAEPEVKLTIVTPPPPHEHLDIAPLLAQMHKHENYSTYEYYRFLLQDLWSTRRVALRRRDVTASALEGAAVGASFAGIIALLLLRRS